MSSILANRVLAAKASATRQMTELANRLKREGKAVITLSQGEPDFDTPAHVREAAKAAIDRGEGRYTDTAGIMPLREAVCRKFKRDNGLTFAPDQVQVSVGAKQILYNALQATVQEGDDVVVAGPCWPSYQEMTILAGGAPISVNAGPNENFKLTPERLEAAITPRTKWLMLNSPSNPAGAVYSADELRALAAVLDRHPHVWVMCDDIYETIRYTDEPFVTMAQVAPRLANRTLTINGLSKAFSMTGWRVGYCAGPVELIRAMNLIQSQSTSHTSSISQHAAVAALDGPMDFIKGFVDAFRRRRDMVVAALNAIPGWRCPTPEGAFYVFPSVAGLIGKKTPDGRTLENDGDVAMFLLSDAQVAPVAGGPFGLANHLRISFATSDALLAEAMERIARACATLR